MLPTLGKGLKMPIKDLRRRFLSKLAYTCDYDKEVVTRSLPSCCSGILRDDTVQQVAETAFAKSHYILILISRSIQPRSMTSALSLG